MPLKKSELYSSIWKSCDELRGGMDASQYKDYVLVMLFVKYVSDKYAGKRNPLIVVPKGGSFADMVALKGQKDIGDGMNKIIGKLAAENDLKGVIDVADFNDADKLGKGKEMQDRLSNLVAIFENPALDFSRNRAEGDDLLGDAYEYLMRHFATESGKSKGQFYTPAEVSRIMAKVIGISLADSADTTIYDPTCGSGSLLLKAADEARTKISIYGQEMDNATAALARMNMILHDNPSAEIWKDNSLSTPHWKDTDGRLKTFDYVVANPPFSSKAWSNGFDPEHDEYGRFEDGIPPQKNGDYAFLLHVLRSMKSTGKGAIVMPHGVLFRGNAEATIRRNLVQRGYIKGIIGLPANLFYGTGIPACIIVMDKENAAGRKGIFMIDASKGFLKDGNKNRLRHQDLHKIVDIFNRQSELPKYSRLVPLAEIEVNDFNLNIPRYIDSSEEEDLQDIAAHLLGGIPERDLNGLQAYWEVFPSLRAELFMPADRPGYSQVNVSPERIKAAILENPAFQAYRKEMLALFQKWQAQNRPRLEGVNPGASPKALIDFLAEDLLAAYAPAPLIDKYTVYQHLMTYWMETLQDDIYLITTDGWKANPELIPQELLIARYFRTEQQTIEQILAEQEALNAELDELVEEHSGEEGLLEEAKTDAGKLTKTSLKARLKEIADGDQEETELLNQCLGLMEEAASKGKAARDAQKALDTLIAKKYSLLTEAEVKTLVVDDKWLASLTTALQGELDYISQILAGRIKELAERYAAPLSQLQEEVETLSARVDEHLKKMGFTW